MILSTTVFRDKNQKRRDALLRPPTEFDVAAFGRERQCIPKRTTARRAFIDSADIKKNGKRNNAAPWLQGQPHLLYLRQYSINFLAVFYCTNSCRKKNFFFKCRTAYHAPFNGLIIRNKYMIYQISPSSGIAFYHNSLCSSAKTFHLIYFSMRDKRKEKTEAL